MRTTGTSQQVYEAARDYANGPDDDCPTDPVVRRENGVWALESSLEPACDADFECLLCDFDIWFGDEYRDPEYAPSEADVADFVHAMRRDLDD